jgi:hypothetical protein
MKLPELTPLTSTHVIAAHYDDATGVMTVRYHNGRTYQRVVDRRYYDGLITAPSAGVYNHHVLKALGGWEEVYDDG